MLLNARLVSPYSLYRSRLDHTNWNCAIDEQRAEKAKEKADKKAKEKADKKAKAARALQEQNRDPDGMRL